ncbi:Hypothetical protein Cp262_1141 [Corynebacterium pseudotuberculosis]|uniref:prepilin peptidase n=1 Tax=Corynebacterium pseudotuberculosis TaxID=1719 RepID=UPI00065E2918|nr:A24 family peptidase [Corynebacterium pseudotuberculosis]AKP08804.1 Hypothetical protein Cp262_1141 [Corynebacterium pseudotuberculosis]
MGEQHNALMLGGSAEIAVALIILVWAGVLCFQDLWQRTIPDILTIPVIVGIVAGSVGAGQLSWLLGGMIWGGTYFLLGIILQGAIGGGDIKLALITGTSAAMHSPLAVVYAMIAAQLVTLCAGTMMYFYEKTQGILARREKKKSHADGEHAQRHIIRIPHGPAMLLSTALSYVVTP